MASECSKPVKIRPDRQLIDQWLSGSSWATQLSFNALKWILVTFPQNEVTTHHLVRQCFQTLKYSCQQLIIREGQWINLFECLESMKEVYSQLNQKIDMIQKYDQESKENHLPITIMKIHCTQVAESIVNLTQLASTIDLLQRNRKLQLVPTYLKAIDTYFKLLTPYQDLAIMKEMEKEFASGKVNLRQLVFQTWDAHLESVDSMKNTKLSDLEDLRTSCVVIDQYYPSEVKMNLIKWWTYIQILTYQQLLKRTPFAITNPFDQNYFWAEIKRIRKDHLFPTSWQMDLIYAYGWFSVTRPYLILALDIAEKKAIEDHNAKIAENIALEHTDQKLETNLLHTRLVEFNVYPAIIKTLQFEKQVIGLWSPDTVTQTLTSLASGPIDLKFKGYLSTAFDPYFNYCLNKDHEHFMALILKLENSEQWDVSSADATAYFREATELCMMIQKSLTKYVKIASIPVLCELFKEYQTRLTDYLELIELNLPEKIANSSQKWTVEEVTTIMITSNTANYVSERFNNLIDSLREILTDLGASSQEISQFGDSSHIDTKCSQLGHLTVGLLSDHICDQLKPHLLKIKTVKDVVAKDKEIGEESPYIRALIQVVTQQLQSRTEMSNFSYLCQIVAQKLFVMYLQNLRHPPFKMTEKIAQQLLLDLGTLKQFMISGVVGLKTHKDPSTPTGDLAVPTDLKVYCKVVSQLVVPIENLLHVMTTSNDKLIGVYLLIYPGSTHKEIDEILDLRGISSGQKEQLIANYNQKQSSVNHQLIVGKKDFRGKLSDLRKDIAHALP